MLHCLSKYDSRTKTMCCVAKLTVLKKLLAEITYVLVNYWTATLLWIYLLSSSSYNDRSWCILFLIEQISSSLSELSISRTRELHIINGLAVAGILAPRLYYSHLWYSTPLSHKTVLTLRNLVSIVITSSVLSHHKCFIENCLMERPEKSNTKELKELNKNLLKRMKELEAAWDKERQNFIKKIKDLETEIRRLTAKPRSDPQGSSVSDEDLSVLATRSSRHTEELYKLHFKVSSLTSATKGLFDKIERHGKENISPPSVPIKSQENSDRTYQKLIECVECSDGTSSLGVYVCISSQVIKCDIDVFSVKIHSDDPFWHSNRERAKQNTINLSGITNKLLVIDYMFTYERPTTTSEHSSLAAEALPSDPAYSDDMETCVGRDVDLPHDISLSKLTKSLSEWQVQPTTSDVHSRSAAAADKFSSGVDSTFKLADPRTETSRETQRLLGNITGARQTQSVSAVAANIQLTCPICQKIFDARTPPDVLEKHITDEH